MFGTAVFKTVCFVITLSQLEVYSKPLPISQWIQLPNYLNISDRNCWLKLSESSVIIINELYTNMTNEKLDLVYITFNVKSDVSSENRKANFTMVMKRERDHEIQISEHREVSISFLLPPMKFITLNASFEECSLKNVMYDLSVVETLVTNVIKAINKVPSSCYRRYKDGTEILEIRQYLKLSYSSRDYAIVCYPKGCNNTNCSTVVSGSFLVTAAYGWTYFIVFLSPPLVYILFDILDLSNEANKYYYESDKPYGLSRLLVTISAGMLKCAPKSTRQFKSRPTIRTIIIIWIVNICIHIISIALHRTPTSRNLAFDEFDLLPYSILSLEMKLIVHFCILILTLSIGIAIFYTCGKDFTYSLYTYPMVYGFSSSGSLKSCLTRSVSLRRFIITEEYEDIKEGQYMLSMHAKRFSILINTKFWQWIFRESFSILNSSKRNQISYYILYLPLLLGSLLLFISGAFLNLLWGLFPLIGIFFSCCTTVKTRLDLTRISFIIVIIVIFLQMLFVNNLVFLFNIGIYSVFYGISSMQNLEFPMLGKVIIISAYVVLYWRQFVQSYRYIVLCIFEAETERLSTTDSEVHPLDPALNLSIDFEIGRVKRIPITEFEFVCNQCLPVRKKIINIIVKILLTGTFILLTMTVLYLKGNVGGFSDAEKFISFIIIAILPLGVQLLFNRGNQATEEEKLKKKISYAVNRWNGKRASENYDIQTQQETKEPRDVTCPFEVCCCSSLTNERQVHENNFVSTPNMKENEMVLL